MLTATASLPRECGDGLILPGLSPSSSPALCLSAHQCAHCLTNPIEPNGHTMQSLPPASQETFCYLQNEAKSPFRLKIPSDWTPFGGRPRQTQQCPGQPLAAQAAWSCQLARHDPPATQHRDATDAGEPLGNAPHSWNQHLFKPHILGRGSQQPQETGNSLFPTSSV